MASAKALDFDAIVVGAGPGGSEMAFQLAALGHRVAVLEQDALDREKPCGGGIQAQEIKEFGALPEDVVECTITRARVISPSGFTMKADLSEDEAQTVTVRRGVYDRYLQRRAADAGAEFIERARVTRIARRQGTVRVTARHEGAERTFTCRMVVNAGGVTAGRLTRAMGIPTDAMTYSVTRHVWLKPKRMPRQYRDTMDFYFTEDNPQGYAWVFPKKDVISVGIGAEAAFIRESGYDLDAGLTALIEQHPVASRMLKNCEAVTPRMGGAIPTGDLPVVHSEYGLVIGDAAGFANVIHGGGIYQARKCALIAAPHCDRFLREGDVAALADYDREAHDHFHDYEIRWDRKIRQVLWHPSTIEIVVELGQKDAEVRDALMHVVTSLRSHEEAYRTIERKMIEIIYTELDRKALPYRKAFNSRLKKVFPGDSILHKHANDILLNDEAKRLRAVLGVLAADVFGAPRDVAVNFSLIYEMFHTASLVHDDIMDRSETRRGKPTVHAKHGLADAIITGDMVLSKCYALLGQYADTRHISKQQLMDLLRVVGRTGETCCLGQARDVSMSENREYESLDDYISMIGEKTGSLIEGSVEGGAIVGGASPKQVKAMGEFGLNLGIAFQIVDDSLDLLGGAEANKSVMNDLRQGKATPMLIHTLEVASAAERKALLAAAGNPGLTEKDAAAVVAIYAKHNAIEFTQELSRKYVQRAREALLKLPAGRSRDDLEGILNVVGYWSLLSD